MLGQYSKIAEGNITNISNLNVSDNMNKTFKIPLNLEFEPKKIFIKGKADDMYTKSANASYDLYNEGYNNGVLTILGNTDGDNIYFAFKVIEITKEYMNVKFVKYRSTSTLATLIKFFAIG